MAIKSKSSIFTDDWFCDSALQTQRDMHDLTYNNESVKGFSSNLLDDISEEESRLGRNKFMRDTYAELMIPGNVVDVSYPGGAGQLIVDVESGMYDD